MNNFLQTANGNKSGKVPFWFMRQAGRYLPEYRDLRQTAGGFLDLVYNPQMAAEVTIQPIRRFGMDAAILFSDILVIPQALGQNLKFETGEGPRLNPLSTLEDFKTLKIENIDEILNPIYETIALTRQKLKQENFEDTALIGFAGSPWTVACYMVEGQGTKEFLKTKNLAHEHPEIFQILIDILVQATSHYLIKQIEAGSQVIQLFDSWAGILDAANFKKWVIEPTIQIVAIVREKHPNTPIIGFPRMSGGALVDYVEKTKVNALGLDYAVNIGWAHDNLQSILPVQGNLDPQILLEGGDRMIRTASEILEVFSDKPFIFNLGHGIIKETPIEHVTQLSELIRNFKA